MPGMVPESIPQGEGAFASAQFGEGTHMAQQSRALASQTGTSAPQPGAAPPPQGAPQQPQAPPEPALATQPGPGRPWPDSGVLRGPDGRLDTNRGFSDLTTIPTWRQNAGTWGSHPAAGPYLKLLDRLSKADQHVR